MDQLITNSRMTTFRACPRLHHLKYNLGYQPIATADVLEFGTAWHAGQENWWNAWAEGRADEALGVALAGIRIAASKSETIDAATLAKAELLMLGYHARWSSEMEDLQVAAVEREFRGDLLTPTTRRRARGLKIAGKTDVIVRRRSTGKFWIVEHKSTSSDLSPTSQYWQRLRMDSQISMYFDGAAALGYWVDGCIYDVVSKPDQRPLMATPVDKRKYTKDGKLYANQREQDETVEAFKARMAEVITADPNAYFQRCEVVRLEAELIAARRDTYETALAIRESAKTGRAPRNVGACFAFNRACSFFSVCSGAASLDDPTLFQRSDQIHPELNEPARENGATDQF